MKCLVCDASLQPGPAGPPRSFVPRPDAIGIVHSGLFFRATGNYGSEIFDPLGPTDEHLEVVVCDTCIMRKAESHGIRHAVVDGGQVVAEVVPFRAWRGTRCGSEWMAATGRETRPIRR